MAATYDRGDLVRISATFRDGAGAAHDPGGVFCEYIAPSGAMTTLQYGVDAALVRDGTGRYHVDIDADASGTWRYRFYSTGTGQAAGTGEFYVLADRF